MVYSSAEDKRLHHVANEINMLVGEQFSASAPVTWCRICCRLVQKSIWKMFDHGTQELPKESQNACQEFMRQNQQLPRYAGARNAMVNVSGWPEHTLQQGGRTVKQYIVMAG